MEQPEGREHPDRNPRDRRHRSFPRAHAAAVGEVNVVNKMKEVNAVIGGEETLTFGSSVGVLLVSVLHRRRIVPARRMKIAERLALNFLRRRRCDAKAAFLTFATA